MLHVAEPGELLGVLLEGTLTVNAEERESSHPTQILFASKPASLSFRPQLPQILDLANIMVKDTRAYLQ